MIVNTGIAAAIASQLGGMKGNKDAIAETIENNVRSKIIKESLTDPAYYEKMSALLDEIIRLRKEKAIEYEEYLKRIAELATKVQTGKADDAPAQLDTLGRRALYNNLKDFVPTRTVAQPRATYGNTDPTLALVLKVDEAIKLRRPDSWRGVTAREQMVKQILYEVLMDIDAVNRLYPVIFAQKEY
ncbi:hypothetical protein [Ralstonia solanacearum]|uniref:hypothetical protein n=1 Tax=Ralstonia solanacearum TaxID=305 RepID=UPI001F089943|nr:hypothetical protein [Ralstonia solanacearum]